MKNGRNQAACVAFGAIMLIQKCGFTIEQAIACTGSCAAYIDAMKWLVASGEFDLLAIVLHGQTDLFWAAKRVRPLVEMEDAYDRLSPQQRITWARKKGPDLLFDEVVAPAAVVAGMPTKATFVERRS